MFQSDTEHNDFFKTKEQRGWLDCWHGIFVTRNALLKSVKPTIDQLYSKAIQNLPDCKSAVVSPTQKHNCKIDAVIAINNSMSHPKRRKSGQNKKNICSSSCEFAKCFIHASGYEETTSFEKFDLNALFSIMRNCKEFEQYFISQSKDVLKTVSVYLTSTSVVFFRISLTLI